MKWIFSFLLIFWSIFLWVTGFDVMRHIPSMTPVVLIVNIIVTFAAGAFFREIWRN